MENQMLFYELREEFLQILVRHGPIAAWRGQDYSPENPEDAFYLAILATISPEDILLYSQENANLFEESFD